MNKCFILNLNRIILVLDLLKNSYICIYVYIYIYMDTLQTRTRFLFFKKILFLRFHMLPFPRTSASVSMFLYYIGGFLFFINAL